MAKPELKTASVLAFERKLDPSDAIFSAGRWEERDQGAHWSAVAVREKSVRGTISNRLKTKDQDPAKLDASIQSPNLQTVDVATLPSNADTLRARFTLRLLGGAGVPSACNNADYQQALLATVESYVEEKGFQELAYRFACNIANGRFLWRNRVGAEEVEVRVSHVEGGQVKQSWVFNAHDFPLRDFTRSGNADLQAMASVIERALASKDGYALLDVVAFARMGDAQEVYPSQELILDRGDKKGQKSKTLYVVDGVAGMHSQKIGNALRTIDNWYPAEEGNVGPIAVEPYGSVTSEGRAYRQPKQKADFYNLLDSWVLKGQAPAEGDQHYVMATLIRGGVFGASDKD
ncbi:MAG TPA: type I-F CRISPR-associated protein Csy3 [Pseudomonas xinjiangensis]|uniref:Type I-F CRISPR-associated protein Csy3 n=2 Tax=root TaxID=1 RepID=A0A7V1BLP7_9GAMM|nr:type I-F CRISPR-associated protein Csy3 [Halopseudomonas xinjiangensis]HEC47060.1 type I-F CRISPR-associated protein Csy3 [Halopseudomonas xinjiangensis]